MMMFGFSTVPLQLCTAASSWVHGQYHHGCADGYTVFVIASVGDAWPASCRVSESYSRVIPVLATRLASPCGQTRALQELSKVAW